MASDSPRDGRFMVFVDECLTVDESGRGVFGAPVDI